jgi:hypothetical protein
MRIEMSGSVRMSPLGSEFDSFLYAPIGEDGNGMPLSVLSALARLDVDRGNWLRRSPHYLMGHRCVQTLRRLRLA